MSEDQRRKGEGGISSWRFVEEFKELKQAVEELQQAVKELQRDRKW